MDRHQTFKKIVDCPQKIVDAHPQILWTSVQFRAETPSDPQKFRLRRFKIPLEIAYTEVQNQKNRACGGLCRQKSMTFSTVARGDGLI